ncbi:MAG: tRNA (5-methylaminomethyl-2-thiouridine)(34)-methyltransferase MnmD [Bacteroidales bacterium]|nr:tRNA (5-methylaminomethyl-2-thiouridine)(34)-methyltransferase MnmD [Bacteroidales bacterium]
MQKIILQTTEDGSHTLFVPDLNEHYHSTHGALQESEMVFIQNGLHRITACIKEINVLEVGFGTGLNALLTVLESKKQRRKINYVAVEPEPIAAGILENLNYPTVIGGTEAAGYYKKINEAGWVYPTFLSDYFILSKIQAKLEDISLKDEQFHLVYFDAFGPDVQPELWTEQIFTQLHKCLKKNGILVTYSCKGTVKRALKAAGFTIEKLPGPAGKREVLRATKIRG